MPLVDLELTDNKTEQVCLWNDKLIEFHHVRIQSTAKEISAHPWRLDARIHYR